MATLADLLRQKADYLINLPSEAQRFITSPQAFTELLGVNKLPKETGFAAGAVGVPPKNPYEGGVLNPLNLMYSEGYESGEPIGIAASLLPVAAINKTPKASKDKNVGKGFFDTGDIKRVGLYKSDLDPSRLTANDLRAIQGNLEIPNLRRDITASLDKILANPEINPATISAKQINPNFDLQAVRAMPPSSLEKQFPIAKTYEQMVQGIEPTLQAKMFAQYLRADPSTIRKSGATNYNELIPASYEQLAKENAQQLDRMLNQGMNLSFQKGNLNYAGSPQMLEDALINRHMYTYAGGSPHELLNKIDPYTGLNENQVFRAVHDYYGHGPTGASFGPRGEELAYGSHSQLYSPLAKMAAATETRGQNSFVNYSGINADLQAQMIPLKLQQERLARAGQDTSAVDAKLAELGAQTQYAQQKAFLLPPEMIDVNYAGGVPDYLKPYINPNNPTAATGYHFSNLTDLTRTDPTKYGTGIKGAEDTRLKMADALRNRTYFYSNPNTREVELGPNQYSADMTNLYDVAADPDRLKQLSRNYNQYQGIVDDVAATNAVERMSNQAGYEGIITPNGVISFEPQVVKRIK